MLLKFRQGVVSHKQDKDGNPLHLTLKASNVSLVASDKSPTVLSFCHRDMDYIVELTKDKPNAWTGVSNGSSLFWDMDFLTGKISEGFTNLPVFYTDSAPQNVPEGQHWFDNSNNCMFLFEDGVWKEKLRIFAGKIKNNRIVFSKVGTQAGLTTENYGGFLQFDNFGYPLRKIKNNHNIGEMPRFNTSRSKDMSMAKSLVKFNDFLIGGIAETRLQKFTLVHLKPNRKIVFADAGDPTTRCIGMVANDYEIGDEVDITTIGFKQNPKWAWTDEQMGRPLFYNELGEFTVHPVKNGVVQQVGFVLTRDTIFLDIKRPVILNEPRNPLVRYFKPAHPGSTPPSAIVKYKFSGDLQYSLKEISIGFETAKVNYLQMVTSSIGFNIPPKLTTLSAASDITINFAKNPLPYTPPENKEILISPSGQLTYSFTTLPSIPVNPISFSPGFDIPLIGFNKFAATDFIPGSELSINFNTSKTNIFTDGSKINILSFTIYGMDTFAGKTLNPFSFQVGGSLFFKYNNNITYKFNKFIPYKIFMNPDIGDWRVGFQKDPRKNIFQPGKGVRTNVPAYTFSKDGKVKLIIQAAGKRDRQQWFYRF